MNTVKSSVTVYIQSFHVPEGDSQKGNIDNKLLNHINLQNVRFEFIIHQKTSQCFVSDWKF